MIKIRIKTRVRPTEDLDKVLKAVGNIFTGELKVIDEGEGYYTIEGFATNKESIEKLYNILRIEQVLSAARAILEKKTHGNKIRFILHKQAAYVGKASFIDSDRESPMGGIIVEIETDNPEEFINWLTPRVGGGVGKKHTRSQRAKRKQILKKTFK